MFNNNLMLEKLTKEKENIENMIKSYQNIGQPINNFITNNQTPQKDFVEWRILNENEEVDNLYVPNKTLFINDNMMILKGIDGSLEKWEVKKIYPIDKKDEKINQLEEEIKKLKEMMRNEYANTTSTIREIEQSNDNANENVDTKSKTNCKSITRKD